MTEGGRVDRRQEMGQLAAGTAAAAPAAAGHAAAPAAATAPLYKNPQAPLQARVDDLLSCMTALRLEPQAISLWNADMREVIEPGKVDILAWSSSRDLKAAQLAIA